MEEYQKRVIDERDELKRKVDKLYAFLGSSIYQGLNSADRRRLDRQHDVMSEYEEILSERIAEFV